MRGTVYYQFKALFCYAFPLLPSCLRPSLLPALDFLDESIDVTPIVPALQSFFDDVLRASVSELNFKTIVDGLGGVLYAYPFNGE